MLQKEIGFVQDIHCAKKPVRVPVVLTSDEAMRVLRLLEGKYRLAASLMYGSGLRLLECLRLRVQDVDFDYLQLTVRDGKGQKDRKTMLPVQMVSPLKEHLRQRKIMHDQDLARDCGSVKLPGALNRKYANAACDWRWQYVFPATSHFFDPLDKVHRRHHLHESAMQRSGWLCANQVLQNGQRATRCGTVLQPICLKMDMTFAPFKSYLDMRTSVRP